MAWITTPDLLPPHLPKIKSKTLCINSIVIFARYPCSLNGVLEYRFVMKKSKSIRVTQRAQNYTFRSTHRDNSQICQATGSY